MPSATKQIPLIAHIIYRLDIGGLESVLVQFINHCPTDKFRHVIICLTEFTDFKNRIKNKQVEIFALHKKAGKDLTIYPKMWKLLHNLKPSIVHTYNIATIEHQLTSLLAGVPHRVHAEHGRDFSDPLGTNKKYNLLRKLLRPLISHWVPVSKDLHNWLLNTIGVKEKKNTLVYNGVDTTVFKPGLGNRDKLPDNFKENNLFIIGTVGRLDPVKDQKSLILVFKQLLENNPHDSSNLRLVVIGDGPLRNELHQLILKNKLADKVWLAGSRNDIPDLIKCFDIFALPSIAEGIPMTILEAMATGLPVIATDVGGNSELITNSKEGFLVPAKSKEDLQNALQKYITNTALCQEHGGNSINLAADKFSLRQMTDNYMQLYQGLMQNR